jgi:hypothetical protein
MAGVGQISAPSLTIRETGGLEVPSVEKSALTRTIEDPGRNIDHGRYVVSAVATVLMTRRATRSIAITALSTNAGTTYIGRTGVSTSTGFPLAAGTTIILEIGDPSEIYVIGTASDVLAWLLVG